MKHTPEEQLQFLKDNDLATGFMTAIFNNDKGIGCVPVIIHDVMWKDGQAQLVVEFLNGDVSTMPCTALPGTDDENECMRLKDAIRKDRIEAAIVAYQAEDIQNSDFHMLIATSDEAEDETLGDCLRDQIFLDVIQHCVFDTHGKLKVFIQRGEELFDEYSESPACQWAAEELFGTYRDTDM